MSNKVPSIGKLLLLEIPMLLCVVVGLALTITLLFIGVFTFVFFIWVNPEKACAAWGTIPKMWKPYFMHFRVYRWSYLVLADPDRYPDNMDLMADMDAARAEREHRHWEPPVVDWDEVFFGMLRAFIFGSYAFVYGSLIASVVLSLGGYYAVHYVVNFKNTAPAPAPKVAKQIKHIDSDTQKQEFDLKPLLTKSEAHNLPTKAGVNNFVIITDVGEVTYSAKWTVDPKDPAWGPSTGIYIKESEVNGTAVTFKDQSDNEYHVNVDQPIYFAGNATMVYMFDENGKLMQASRDSVKKVPLGSVHSPAKVNPDMSTL